MTFVRLKAAFPPTSLVQFRMVLLFSAIPLSEVGKGTKVAAGCSQRFSQQDAPYFNKLYIHTYIYI